jgi:hypothetical protein
MRGTSLRRRMATSAGSLAVVLAASAPAPALAGETLTDTTVEKQVAIAQASCVPAETLVLTGTIRHRFKITIDSSGGLHIDDYYSAHGSGSGFNAVTDPGLLMPVAKYTVSDEQLQSTQFPDPTFAYNAVFNTRVIRQGESVATDDLYMVSRVHVTTNANGVPVVDRFDESWECR